MAKAIGKKEPWVRLWNRYLRLQQEQRCTTHWLQEAESINLLETSSVTIELKMAITHPLISGTITANKKGNHPKEKSAFNFRPLVIPMSNKKIAKKPLNKSFVKGSIPAACLSLAINPISRLPRISKTLPFVRECLNAIFFVYLS